MEEATNDTATRQARRIAEACKNGDSSCIEIVQSLLDGRPDLTDRQRRTVVNGAVLLARYGVGCTRCKASAKHMHPEVRAAYVEKYGRVAHGCDVCRDTGVSKADGLRCLACDHLTQLEAALFLFLATGNSAYYVHLMGPIDAVNNAIPKPFAKRAEERFIMIGLAEREDSGDIIVTKQGERRARLIEATGAGSW